KTVTVHPRCPIYLPPPEYPDAAGSPVVHMNIPLPTRNNGFLDIVPSDTAHYSGLLHPADPAPATKCRVPPAAGSLQEPVTQMPCSLVDPIPRRIVWGPTGQHVPRPLQYSSTPQEYGDRSSGIGQCGRQQVQQQTCYASSSQPVA